MKETIIAEDKGYDVSGALIDDDKRIPLAVAFARARVEWQVLDDSVKDDFAALGNLDEEDQDVGGDEGERSHPFRPKLAWPPLRR